MSNGDVWCHAEYGVCTYCKLRSCIFSVCEHMLVIGGEHYPESSKGRSLCELEQRSQTFFAPHNDFVQDNRFVRDEPVLRRIDPRCQTFLEPAAAVALHQLLAPVHDGKRLVVRFALEL